MLSRATIRLSVVGGRALSYKIVQTTDETNEVRLESMADSRHDLAIRYSYLNQGDGVVVELMHDGTAAKLVGKAKGVNDGPEDWGSTLPHPPKRARVWDLVSSLGLLLVAAALWAIVLFVDPSATDQDRVVLGTGLTAMSLVGMRPEEFDQGSAAEGRAVEKRRRAVAGGRTIGRLTAN